MTRLIYVALAIITVLAASWVDGKPNRKDCVTLPPEAAKLVVPILDAMQEAVRDTTPINEEEGTPFWRVGVLIGKLIEEKSPASDEALVVLLYYYNGEANDEDRLREITIRGKRMLPYLHKYQTHCPRIPGRKYSKILLPPKTVGLDFMNSIDMIKKGELIQ